MPATSDTYKLIFDKLPQPLWLVNSNGDILKSNENTKEFLATFYRELKDLKNIFDILDSIGCVVERKELGLLCEKSNTILFTAENKNANQHQLEINKLSQDEYIVSFTVGYPENGFLLGNWGLQSNITEKKKAETKLRENEEKFRRMAENISDVVWVSDLQLNTTYISPSVEKLLGESPEEHISKPLHEKFPPEELSYIADLLNKSLILLKQGKIDVSHSELIEARHKKKDGTYVWVAMNVSFLHDEQGEIIGFQGVSRNIDAQKQLELQLRESESRYKSIISVSNTGAWEYHRDTGRLWCSPEYFTMLGYDSDIDFQGQINSIQRSWAELLHPEDKAKAMGKFEKYLEAGSQGFYESLFRMKHKNEGWIWIWSRGQTLRDENDKPTNLTVGTHIDVHKQKEFETALRNSEEKYRLIVEKSPLGILQFDRDGIITECNRNFVEIIGSSKEKLVGLNMMNLPDMRIANVIKTVIEGQSASFEGEYTSVTAEKVTPVRLLFSPIISEEGKVLGGIGMVEDRSTHNKKQELEQELGIAAESVKFKQNFLANMSHEIRTPLTGIMGMIEVLNNTPMQTDQKEYLDILKSSGQNLKTVIDQVLDFSKIEAGKMLLKPLAFDFRKMAQEACSLYDSLCVNKGIILKLEWDNNIPQNIFADKSRLTQVLNNLISNAVKFTSEGNIIVSAKLISEGSKYLCIKMQVSDTGIGVPPDKVNQLFKPFTQTEHYDIRKYDGTGLGLSISKELVKIMEGNIGYEPQQYGGSTFWFDFKSEQIPDSQYPLSHDITEDDFKLAPLHILLVEDKFVNQKVINLLLGAHGHKLQIANHGLEALERFKEGKFDIILMDIQMPVMDGISATQKIKSKYSLVPPIIGLSANAFEGDKEKYMELGLDEYLTKPLEYEEFKKVVCELLKL